MRFTINVAMMIVVYVHALSGSAHSQGTTVDLADPGNFSLRLDSLAYWNQTNRNLAHGDFNADGYLDLVIGSYIEDQNGRLNSGSIYVIFGEAFVGSGSVRDMQVTNNFNIRFDGAQADDQLGWAVACGDVNADGFDDIVASAFQAGNNGRTESGSVYVIHGHESQEIGKVVDLASTQNFGFRYDGPGSLGELGWAVAVGDINGDGLEDVIAAADLASHNQLDKSGSVYVLFGRDETGPGSVIDLANADDFNLRFDGASEDDEFGSSVAVGEFNGDGHHDLLVGAWYAGHNGRRTSGSAYVIHGAAQSGTGIIRHVADPASYNLRFDGPVLHWHLGEAVSFGDFNGDGFDDALVGVDMAANNDSIRSGSVYIAFGEDGSTVGDTRDLLTSSNYNIRFDGHRWNDFLGQAIATGDHNADGYADPIFGVSRADRNSRERSGCVYLIHGEPAAGTGTARDLGSPASYARRHDGASVYDLLGSAVATRDVNGDGYDDILSCAHMIDTPDGGGTGMVYSSFPIRAGLRHPRCAVCRQVTLRPSDSRLRGSGSTLPTAPKEQFPSSAFPSSRPRTTRSTRPGCIGG